MEGFGFNSSDAFDIRVILIQEIVLSEKRGLTFRRYSEERSGQHY